MHLHFSFPPAPSPTTPRTSMASPQTPSSPLPSVGLLKELRRSPRPHFPTSIAMPHQPPRALSPLKNLYSLGRSSISGVSRLNLGLPLAFPEKDIILDERFPAVRVLASIACGVFVLRCQRAMAADTAGNVLLGLKRSPIWPKVLQVLNVFKDQGLILAVLLGLSAFFSMAETSITTLWPWKILEANERKVGKVRFKPINNGNTNLEAKGVNLVVSTKVVRRKKSSGREAECKSRSDLTSSEKHEHDYSDGLLEGIESTKHYATDSSTDDSDSSENLQ